MKNIKGFQEFVNEAWGTDNKCDNCAGPLTSADAKCKYCGVIPVDKSKPAPQEEQGYTKAIKSGGSKRKLIDKDNLQDRWKKQRKKP